MSTAVSEDAVLGGRLVLRQPLRGHRFGHDAILLAAAVCAHAGEHAVDLGAGVGAAGLALARRVEGLRVTLVEKDPALARLAAENAAHNGLGDRVGAVCLDVGAPAAVFAKHRLARSSVDHVLMNPPFNAPQNPSADPGRRSARVASPQTLPQWAGAAKRLLRPAGVLTMIWRADGLPDVLHALADFGALSVLPVHPKPGAPAVRILVRAIKGRSGPLSLQPGLILADAEGRPSRQAEEALRDAAALHWA